MAKGENKGRRDKKKKKWLLYMFATQRTYYNKIGIKGYIGSGWCSRVLLSNVVLYVGFYDLYLFAKLWELI